MYRVILVLAELLESFDNMLKKIIPFRCFEDQ